MILTHVHTVIASNTNGQLSAQKKATDANMHKKTEWSDIDKNILGTLPEDIRKEIEKQYSNGNAKRRKKRSIKDMFSAQRVAGVHSVKDDCAKNIAISRTLDDDMPISMQQSHSKRAKNCNHAPIPASFQDIDTAVFAELPEDIRLELSRAYKTKSSVPSRQTTACPQQKRKKNDKNGDNKTAGRKQKSLYDMFQLQTS